MANLIGVDELRRRLEEPDLILVDVRFDLADTAAGERYYEEEHIPGAVYAHLDRDLSGPIGDHGGRHPLPDPQELAVRLGLLGIGDEHTVIVYDDITGMYASRLWW